MPTGRWRSPTPTASAWPRRCPPPAGDPSQLGADRETLDRIGCFVELHVEQGRGLIELEQPVAVGSAIWPHGRWRIDLPGEANHAGTTRLADRHDPMLAYARLVLAARAGGRAA